MLIDLIKEIKIYVALRERSSTDFVSWLASRPLIEDWDRRQVYDFCLGRLPEFEPGATSWTYDSREECAAHIAVCLLSFEFRSNIVEILGRAAPWIRRIFFIHIPRTGGTSVQRAIESGFAGIPWHVSYDHDEWLKLGAERRGQDPLDFMLEFLAQFADRDARLFVQGHLPLGVLMASRSIRTIDKVFAIGRAPEEIILSNLAYMTEIVLSGSTAPDAVDWSSWFRAIGCDWSQGSFSPADLGRILRSDRFKAEYGNPLTRYLSLDGKGFGTAEALSVTNCSVMTLRSAPAYLSREFGVDEPMIPINGSTTAVRALLDASALSYIKQVLCSTDSPLWARYDERRASFLYDDELKAA